MCGCAGVAIRGSGQPGSEVTESGKRGRGGGEQHRWGAGTARGQFQRRAMALRLGREAILLARTRWVMALEPSVVCKLLSQVRGGNVVAELGGGAFSGMRRPKA